MRKVLSRRFRPTRATLAGMAVFAGFALMMEVTARLGPQATDTLQLTRDTLVSGEVYRLVTAHFVHLSPAHSLMNQLGLLLLAIVLAEVLSARRVLLASLASALAISFGALLWHPDFSYYVGFSGVTHGLFAWGGLALIRAGQPGHGALVLVAVTAKLVWEAVIGPTPGSEDTIGGPVFLPAHLYGVIGGIAFGLCEGAARRAAGTGVGQSAILLIAAGTAALTIGIPRDARAHEDIASHVTLAFLENGEALLRIETSAAAFVLRQPPGVLSPEMRNTVAAMGDTGLQDYLNGASDYLLSRTRLVTEDSQTIAPGSIRVPTLDRLRQDAMRTSHHLESPDLFLLFDAPALADVTGRVRLIMPPELGHYGLVVVTEMREPVRFNVMPGTLSPPFAMPDMN